MYRLAITCIGFVGMALIVGAYFLNSYAFIPSTGVLYLTMNLVGSVLVGIDVYTKRAWSAVTLQVIWILISLSALAALL